jgi:hypothetical protein
MKALVNFALITVCYALNTTNSESGGLRTPIRSRSPSPRRPPTPSTPTDRRIQIRPDILNAPPRQRRIRFIEDSDAEPVPTRRINLDGENFITRIRDGSNNNEPQENNLNSPIQINSLTDEIQRLEPSVSEFEPESFNLNESPVRDGPRRPRNLGIDLEPDEFELDELSTNYIDVNDIIINEIPQNGESNCSICLAEDEGQLVVLECNHAFHRDWYFIINIAYKGI